MSLDGYAPIEAKVRGMDGVETRPMFGYRCFLVCGKFFIGFYNKDDHTIIIRLPKDQQALAIRQASIKPFSHGAKMGWVELDSTQTPVGVAMRWISVGYEHAKRLAGKA